MSTTMYGFTTALSAYLLRLITPAKRDYAEAYANGLVRGWCVPDPSYFGLAADKVAKVQAQVRKFALVEVEPVAPGTDPAATKVRKVRKAKVTTPVLSERQRRSLIAKTAESYARSLNLPTGKFVSAKIAKQSELLRKAGLKAS